MNKKRLILKYLQSGRSLTAMQATELFKTTKLTTIISELRKKHDILGIKKEGVDEIGTRTYWNEYHYVGEKKHA